MLKSCISKSFTMLLLFLSVSCTYHENEGIAGVDPIDSVYIFENHYESYIIWKKHDVKDRILIHFDGHIDMDWIPESYMNDILSCKTADDLKNLIMHPYQMKPGFQGKISIWNFIYPAVRSGMIKDFIGLFRMDP